MNWKMENNGDISQYKAKQKREVNHLFIIPVIIIKDFSTDARDFK